MKYPGLLDQDISRVGLQESQMYNLISGKLVTEIVKTSFGPRGMEKVYIDILGEDTITSHGGAFLRKVDVDHPGPGVSGPGVLELGPPALVAVVSSLKCNKSSPAITSSSGGTSSRTSCLAFPGYFPWVACATI